MRIESPEFSVREVREFLDEFGDLDLLPQVQDRDMAGSQLSSLPPDQLLAMAQREIHLDQLERTLRH